ncbi:MAG: hypothetical protein Q4B54_00665 [Coriobacteriales bacterium]|nr:hypothetical protein [Coriobacteriales bacterium]
MRRRSHGIIKTLFTLIIVALLVEAGFVGWSAWQIKGKGEAMREAYSSYEAQVDNGNYEGALASMRTVASSVQGINQELKGWQWQLAGMVPVLGEDVTCAQKASQISDNLVSQALLPVIQKVENLFGEASTEDLLSVLSTKMDQAGELVSAIEQARTVVESCRSQALALPTTHFPELNQAIAQLQQVLVEANKNFDEFSGLIDLASSAKDFASSLI